MGPKGYSLNSLAEKKPNTALSGCALLVSCTQQCAIVVRRLEDVEKTDKGGMVALLLPLSLSVIKLRLHLWGQIAAESLDDSAVHYSSVDHPFQTLVKVNGIICELDVVVNALIQDTEDEVCGLFPFGFIIGFVGEGLELLRNKRARHSLPTLPEIGIRLANCSKNSSTWLIFFILGFRISGKKQLGGL